MPLTIALKEWDLVITSLLAGRQAILLRKGGILESENQFELEHPTFLLYPTFIHQDPRMVKPELRGQIQTHSAEPSQIELRGYAEAVHIFEVPSRAQMDQLDDLHIWDPPLLDMRFSYRAEKPLYLVLLRAFTLPAAITIPNTIEYAGCKSWVPLQESISTDRAVQAMSETAIQSLQSRLDRTLKRNQ